MGQLEQKQGGLSRDTFGTPGWAGTGNPIVLNPAPTVVTFAIVFPEFYTSTTFTPLYRYI